MENLIQGLKENKGRISKKFLAALVCASLFFSSLPVSEISAKGQTKGEENPYWQPANEGNQKPDGSRKKGQKPEVTPEPTPEPTPEQPFVTPMVQEIEDKNTLSHQVFIPYVANGKIVLSDQEDLDSKFQLRTGQNKPKSR